LVGIPALLPPPNEQAAIATFLDRETAKIDALIAEQQRLIELLQEKRQAVISHAVTKGLNPDAAMKDSGIEWLGAVPEHWEVTRLDRVSDFVNGKAHEPFVHDDGRFICVTSRFISTDGEALKMCSENLTPAQRDDILMVMSDLPDGRALARTFHVQDNRAYAINQRVCAIRPTRASPRYLFYLLNRNPWFLQNDDGMNQTHLSVSDFRKMPLVLPPIDEQEAIGQRLDSAVTICSGLIGHAETCIGVLQERRSALISAAVTGQIDVRNYTSEGAAA
jgi:type I restriction enzyme S subunit